MPLPERRPRHLRLVSLAASGVLVVPSLVGCGSGGSSDQTAYCVDANNQVVDDSNCDESHGYGGGLFFLYLAGGGFGRGSYIPTTAGGARINPADTSARVNAGLPGTGKAAGTTIRSGGIGKGSGGSTGGTGFGS